MNNMIKNTEQELVSAIGNETYAYVNDFCNMHPATIKTVMFLLVGSIMLYGAATSAKAVPSEYSR